MKVKEAILAAKRSIADLFESEAIEDIRLEEVRFDDARGRWLVTIGFERPRPASRNFMDRLGPDWQRDYKVVAIEDETGEAVSVTDRSLEQA